MSAIESLSLLMNSGKVTHSDISEVAGISKHRLLYYLHFKKDLPISSVLNLCSNFNLSVENFLKNEFSVNTAVAYYLGDRQALPDHLLVHPYSKMRTIGSIFSFSEKKFGHAFANSLLAKFQIPKDLLSDPYKSISVEAVNGMFERLMDVGAASLEIGAIGTNSALSFLGSKFGEKCLSYRGKADYWEQIFAENGGLIEYVDKNADYKILKARSKELVIEMKSRQWARDYFKCENYGNQGWAYNGAGFGAGLCMGYNGFIGVGNILKSYASGDSANVFRIEIR